MAVKLKSTLSVAKLIKHGTFCKLQLMDLINSSHGIAIGFVFRPASDEVAAAHEKLRPPNTISYSEKGPLDSPRFPGVGWGGEKELHGGRRRGEEEEACQPTIHSTTQRSCLDNPLIESDKVRDESIYNNLADKGKFILPGANLITFLSFAGRPCCLQPVFD